jgi:3-hydroxy-9,10-secoandrosta-1,3,5(10)-triene-9,17-dione monooxygenase
MPSSRQPSANRKAITASIVSDESNIHHARCGAAALSRSEAVRRARSLGPRIRARAASSDADRSVADETMQELLASGLFGIVKPRVFGGAELGIAALVEVTIELAAACGSTGWVYGVLAGHGWLMNLFPVDAQREVFDDPHALTATVFRLDGTVTPVEGGYRLVNGKGRFCSGIDHASWVIVGNAVVGAAGPPEPRFFVLPRADVEVIDDWFTAGMRGTGSRSIRISEAFIPAYRSVGLEELSKGTSPGAQFHAAPLYRMPFQLIAPFSIVGVPLGIARGALETFSQGLSCRLEASGEATPVAKSTTLARMAHAAVDIDASLALVMQDARLIDEAADADALTSHERARIPRNWAFAAQTARTAVTRLFEGAGGSAIYDASELQRMWRDVSCAAQHYAFVWDNAMADYGRALLGLAPTNPGPGRR